MYYILVKSKGDLKMIKFKINNQIIVLRIDNKIFQKELKRFYGYCNPVRVPSEMSTADKNKFFYQLLDNGYLMNLKYPGEK